MAVEPAGPRPRRAAVWPWLVMPLVVLAVFYGLHRVHRQPQVPPPPSAVQPQEP